MSPSNKGGKRHISEETLDRVWGTGQKSRWRNGWLGAHLLLFCNTKPPLGRRFGSATSDGFPGSDVLQKCWRKPQRGWAEGGLGDSWSWAPSLTPTRAFSIDCSHRKTTQVFQHLYVHRIVWKHSSAIKNFRKPLSSFNLSAYIGRAEVERVSVKNSWVTQWDGNRYHGLHNTSSGLCSTSQLFD